MRATAFSVSPVTVTAVPPWAGTTMTLPFPRGAGAAARVSISITRPAKKSPNTMPR